MAAVALANGAEVLADSVPAAHALSHALALPRHIGLPLLTTLEGADIVAGVIHLLCAARHGGQQHPGEHDEEDRPSERHCCTHKES